MNWLPIEQRTKEWYDYKVAKIGGTGFGQATSSRENSLLFVLCNQKMDGFIMPEDFENDDMQYGLEHEEEAINDYEIKSGIKFKRGGVIVSDFFPEISMASPDGVNLELGIVVECKCTRFGEKQIQRFVKGPETSMMPQIINYFVQSDTIREVHWFSWCENRPERKIVERIYTPDSMVKDGKTQKSIRELVIEGRLSIQQIQKDLIELHQSFIF